MLVPVDLHNQHDDVADANRRARDAYWDNVIGSRVPLSEPGARLRDLPAADMLFQFPVEIPNPFDGYVLLIGRVGGYKTLLSSTERSVYTELEFRVETILGGPDIPLLRKDQVISIGRAGGTIIAPWGRLESYVRTPEKYDFSPGRTYFIAAGYHANGDFYTMHGIQRRWDLTDGTVVPDSPIEVARAQRDARAPAGRTPSRRGAPPLPAWRRSSSSRRSLSPSGRRLLNAPSPAGRSRRRLRKPRRLCEMF